MSRFAASFQSLAQPRIAAVALIGLALAGCSNSSRFDTPYASNNRPPAPQQRQPEYTGSVAQRPQPTSRIVSQPLPSAPQTMPVQQSYQPAPIQRQPEYTGSVAQPAAPRTSGGWTWDGGSPVTVGQGDTVEMIARRHAVPAQAILQTNGITNAASVRPGQRLVIPRYVTSGPTQYTAPQPQQAQAPLPRLAAPAAVAAAPAVGGTVHVVGPGESLMGIARKNNVALSTLAQANNLEPHTQLRVGDRITVPGAGRQAQTLRPAPAMTMAAPVMVAPQQAQAMAPAIAAPQVVQPRQIPMERQVQAQAAPVQTARMATQEPATTETAASGPEAAGAVPSFRWPVHGRVIAGFGSKPNGVQNDGINLAVPEGTPVKAAEDGVVAYAGNELKGYGNLVLIRHANGYVSAYANAKDILVKRGDSIKRGQVIVNSGQTGNVTSPQLHFEIRKGSTPVDPTKYLGGSAG